MARTEKNIRGVDRLDDAALRWLDTAEGESCVKADIEEKWSLFAEAPPTPDIGCKRRRRNRLHRAGWIAAASAAVLLTVGVALHYLAGLDNRSPNTPISHVSESIRLTLPDGKQIILDRRTENGIVAEQGGVSLIRENGTLIHEKQNAADPQTQSDPQSEPQSERQSQWSMLEVPRGSRFDLILEDGTHVWLNAASRLRFPVAFGDGERRVFVEGEAYFAVARDTERPFTVETPRQDVTVLGTEFNIYAYPDEPHEHTTLIEGGVTLKSRNNGSVTLAPGQQAVLLVDKYIVREVEAHSAAAWRDGVFVLDGDTFGEVFLKLSRWYDFTYSFEDEGVSRLTLSGNLRRYDDAGVIFGILETVGGIRIDVSGNHAAISKK